MNDETIIALILACDDKNLIELKRSEHFEQTDERQQTDFELIQVGNEFVIITHYEHINSDESSKTLYDKSIEYFDSATEADDAFEKMIAELK